MTLLSPFGGWLVTAEAAPRVVAAARERLLTRDRLVELLTADAYRPVPRAAYHVLRLRTGGHTQTGIVGTVPVNELGQDVRFHERTRPAKVEALARHLASVGASSAPVGLAHDGAGPAPEIVATVTQRPPELDLRLDDGLHQQVWAVTDPAATAAIRAGLARVGPLYVTDGHHRTAAARRLAGDRSGDSVPGEPAPDPAGQLLAVVFPAGELHVLPYHRVVRDVTDPSGLLEGIAARADLSSVDAATPPRPPTTPGRLTLHLAGRWYRLALRGPRHADDPVAALDVTRLHEEILAPLLGITDPDDDPRLQVVPATAGPGTLARRAGTDGAVFALAPIGIRQLMAVADAGAAMPYKSTFFHPKLPPGVFLHPVGHVAAPSTRP